MDKDARAVLIAATLMFFSAIAVVICVLVMFFTGNGIPLLIAAAACLVSSLYALPANIRVLKRTIQEMNERG